MTSVSTTNEGTSVPPYRGTKLHSMRIPDEVWTKALTRAEAERTSVSAEVVAFLREYGDAPKKSWTRPRRGK